jgi:hypothetical protein
MARKPPGKPPSERINRPGVEDACHAAMHQAGCAVAAVVYGVPLSGVDIRPRRLPDGSLSSGFVDANTRFSDEGDKVRNVLPILTFMMAGAMAESEINPRFHGGEQHHRTLTQMKSYAVAAVCEPETTEGGLATFSGEDQLKHRAQITAVMEDASSMAAGVVRVYRSAVDEIARLLVEKKSLSAQEVGDIVTAHPKWPTKIQSNLIHDL